MVLEKTHDPEAGTAASQVTWLLAHPHTSEWLKTALRSAQGCNPVAVTNDLEILRHVFQRKVEEEVVHPLRSLSRTSATDR